MINRRDLLTLTGGAAAGLAFTPVPWKLLDDTAIWTQNWSWTPRLPRGEVTERTTHCTLCPAACAMRARCVGGKPVSLAPVEGDPAGGGRLCTVGLVAHHLAYHPRRVRQVLHYGRPSTLESLYRTVAERAGGTGFAIVDGNPRRTVSRLYARLASQHLAAGYEPPVDLEHTRTILSFGVPVLDDWGAPARLWNRRRDLRVIQVEPTQSRTALMADLWLPVRPGSEAALALAIAGRVAPQEAAAQTGLTVAQILEAAQAFREGKPAIALGAPGEFLNDPQLPGPGIPLLRNVPDRSLAVVLLDSPISLQELEPKLAPGPVVISLSPLIDERIPWQVPVPVFGESVEDTPGNHPRFSFALAAALTKPPAGIIPIDDVLAGLARAIGAPPPPSLEETRRTRAAQLAANRGRLVNPDGSPHTLESPDKLWDALLAGARLVESEPQPPTARPAAQPPAPPAPATGLTLLASHWKGSRLDTPLLTKLYRESGIRAPGDMVRLHPDTANALGLRTGDRARLKTKLGATLALVRIDPRVLPDILEAEAAPGGRVAALASGPTPASLEKA